MSYLGIENIWMPTSIALDSEAPMQKLDHVFVDENVYVEGPTNTKTRGKQVGLPNVKLIVSPQDKGLRQSRNWEIYFPKSYLRI